jgi:hypothetical protein
MEAIPIVGGRSCAQELEQARAELARLRELTTATPPRTPRAAAVAQPRSPRVPSALSARTASVVPSTASSATAARLQRAVALVEEGGKPRPLTEWIVSKLLSRGVADTGMTRTLALRTALQAIDRAGTGEVTPEQLAAGLQIRNLALGQVAGGPSPMMQFSRPKASVGPEEIRACFARWNGGGSGRTLRYAHADFRVVRRMLDEDYPRNRHPLGETCDPTGRLITDVAAQWGSLDADLRQRRYHDSYWSARNDALQLRSLHPSAPADVGALNSTSQGVLQLTVCVARFHLHPSFAQTACQPGMRAQDFTCLPPTQI